MIKKVLLYLIFGFFLSFTVTSQQTITWIKLNFAPGYLEDENRDGFLDQSLLFINDKLKSYTHEYQKTNLKRLFIQFQRGDFIATNGLLKNNQREEFIYFSEIAQISFPNHLIIKKKNLSKIEHLLNSKGEIPLYRIIQETDLKLGIIHQRSYGDIIDQTLLSNKDSPNIHTVSLLTNSNELFKAVNLDRIHYVIEYPVIANYNKEIGYIKEDIISIPVEGMPEYLSIYFCFPKTPWGAKLRDDVNKILLEYRHTDEFLNYYGSWLNQDEYKRCIAIAKKVFNKD